MCFATHIKTSNRVGENKFLPHRAVRRGPVYNSTRECETFSVNSVLEGLLW